MNASAQASLEFMIILGVALLLLTAMTIVIYQKYVQSSEFKMQAEGRRIINRIADSVNEIVSVGPGYHKCLTLQGGIYGGRYYSVYFYEDEPTVFLETEDMIWSAPLNSMNVSCSISPPCGMDTSGEPIDVWVSNYGGRISLEYRGPCENDWIGVS